MSDTPAVGLTEATTPAASRRQTISPPPAKTCRHCGGRVTSQPRSLCYACYYTRGVRDLYPTESKFGRRNSNAGYMNQPCTDSPTAAPPGSAEKVAALEKRATLGVSLWHPQDATTDTR